MMMDGESASCEEESEVLVSVMEKTTKLSCLVIDLLPGVDILFGMDAIRAVGGMKIDGRGRAVFAATSERSLLDGRL